MSSHELAIASVIIGIFGIIFSALIVIWVRTLDSNQRKRDQKSYEISTTSHVKILINNIVRIVELSGGDNDFPDDMELENRTYELRKYLKKNNEQIAKVAQDAKFALALWLDVPKNKKKETEEIISLTMWLLDKYLPQDDESIETQQRRWQSKFTELENRKNQILEKYEH